MPFAIDRTRLPSTAALTAFEAAARLGSFTEAAKELNLTQGAVSRQVKTLEEQLEVQLFERSAQRIELTDIGRAIAAQIRGILDQFLVAMGQIATDGPTTLTLAVLPTVASRWLIPRLSGFTAENPHITIRLTRANVDFYASQSVFDAMLILGTEVPPDMVSHKVGDEDFVVVGAPQWIAAHHITGARDLIDKRLLVETARPEIWNKWFQINGLPQHLHTRYMYFDYFDMVISAAISNLGVALAPRMLVEGEIAAGRLQMLEGEALSVGTSYLLSYPAQKAQYPPLLVFRNWLLGTMAKDA